MLSSTAPSLVLHGSAYADSVARLSREDGWRALDLEADLDREPPSGRSFDPVAPGRAWLLVHTSGTTGVPKGVVLTNEQLAAAATAVIARLGCRPGERWLAAMPMHHVGGLSVPVRAAVGGLSVVLHEGFDAAAVRRSLDTESIAWVSLVPTMLASLLDLAPATTAPRALRGAILGGGRLPPRLVERAAALGWPLVATYGMTETAAQVTTSHPGDAASHPGSAGHPLPGNELRIDSPGPDGVGEIVVRGAQVAGRDGAEAALEAAERRERWLHTGDLGRVDADGRLWVETRRTDLIVTGGENVHPEEVEDVLLLHPSVVDAGVFAVDDERWGQVVGAAVVAGPGAPSDGDLQAWCRARLAGFKVPRRWLRLDRLPRNAAGKLERLRLRERVHSTSEASAGSR
ncbi:MAG: AMP-binding protein [Alphaproteobacteria bacterium]